MLRLECLGDTLGKISWVNPKRSEGSMIWYQKGGCGDEGRSLFSWGLLV